MSGDDRSSAGTRARQPPAAGDLCAGTPRGSAGAGAPDPSAGAEADQRTLAPGFSCLRCAAPVTAVDPAARAPFLCESGHALSLQELLLRPGAEHLDQALDALAHSVEQATRGLGKALYRYQERDRDR